jgi:hypothetical protein
MCVMVVHNRYRSALPSGENTVVDQEIRWLAAAGVAVTPFVRSSDVMSTRDRALLPVSPIWAPLADFARLLRATRPDVVHLHNPYPLISPRVVRIAHRFGVPVVQTVHNSGTFASRRRISGPADHAPIAPAGRSGFRRSSTAAIAARARKAR